MVEAAAGRARPRRSWPVPTWRLGAAAAVLSIVAAILPPAAPWGLAVVYGVLLVAAIVDWSMAVAPARVGVVRTLPASLTLGQVGTIRWEVANPARRGVRVAVADELAPALQAGSRRARLEVPPGGVAATTTDVRPLRRGDFCPAELVVRVDGPLGLMARQASRCDPSLVRVLPPFRSRQEAELRIDRARILEVGLRSAKARGGGTEFEQLREYVVDDEFRRIDWAATARAGRPIVRSFRAERNQVVLSLLDTGRTMAGRVAGVPRLEHAMDAVMMLTAVATRLGDRAGLVAFDRQIRAVVQPTQARAQFGRVVEAMYRLEPELVESDYRRAFTETLVRFRRRALLVILTELADQAVQETLLRDLPQVARSHLVLIGAVRDPDVQRWARYDPTDAGAAYRKAAAIAALTDRRRLVATLAAMGATVVDALPGQLAPQLADAYLRAKATGRL
ncbi:MAG TPA: DUF58 domain-containing protein [Acidimicrobiales bacterium]|jgi:uncharacterized protein (DUF58 family)|nr:DUF58 domain-containing protein [Acidimicrobiales bacterium]